MSSSVVQRRSSRTSVLGKRTHQSQLDAPPSPASIKSVSVDLLDDDDDASTVDSGPCAKRPRTSLVLTDRNQNKENIPPLRRHSQRVASWSQTVKYRCCDPNPFTYEYVISVLCFLNVLQPEPLNSLAS